MIKQIFDILTLFFSSLAYNKSSSFKYGLITGFLGLVISTIVLYFGWNLSEMAGEFIASLIPWSWPKESMLFSFLIMVAFSILLFMVLKYVLLICLSPLLSYFSERTESQITGVKSVSAFNFATSAARSVRINMRNLVKELFISICLFIFSFIPFLNIVSIPLLFLVQAYFVGFGLMDFYLERHFTFRETISEVYRHKWAAITLGIIFMIMIAIPILGIMVAPFVTTIVGTKYFANKQVRS